MSATYAKLKSGDWGIRSTVEIKAGQTVTVVTKAGDRKTETVGKIVWSGNGVWLATKGGGSAESNGYRRAGSNGGHKCHNGHADHPGPCCNGRHGSGYDCGAGCCELD